MRNNSMLKAGRYWVKVINQGLGKSGTGNTQLVMEVQPLGLVNPDNTEEYIEDESLAGVTRRYYRAITDGTMPFFTEELKVLGFKGDSFGQLDPKHPRHWSFKDQMVMMFCQHGMNQRNEPREEWGIARSSALVKEKQSDDKLRELDVLFAKNLEYLRSDQPVMGNVTPKKDQSKQRPVTVPAGANQEIDDLDVPF
jgi:hypothetical protein